RVIYVFLMCLYFFFFFFFFQAEDGIRDRTVTGVQTCALPIYVLVPGHLEREHRRCRRSGPHRLLASGPLLPAPSGDRPTLPARRSEERRVGKECRSRGRT